MQHGDNDQHEGQEPELAEIRYLPTRVTGEDEQAEVVDEGEVLEAELVDEDEYQRLINRSQKELAIERWRGYGHDVQVAYRASKTVATHQRTKTLVRHTLAYPVAGLGVVVKNWRDNHGANRYERQMRAAEAMGDQEGLRYWQEAGVAEKQRRHQRTMDWIKAPGQWIKAGVIGLAGLAAFLLALGILLAINSGEIADVIGPITAVVTAVAFLVWFLMTYGVFLLLGGTAMGLYYLYQQGRAHAAMPTWLAAPVSTDGPDGRDVLVSEDSILDALRHLGIPKLNEAFKAGWGTSANPSKVWEEQVTRDGQGYRARLRLPKGVDVETINTKKNLLAHNLVRFPVEVWPTTPKGRPGVMDLWVADPNVLTQPVGNWPWMDGLDEMVADFFAGVPVGKDMRGDVVNAQLFQKNYAIAGEMSSGKSSLAMNLVSGAALDPLVDLDVFVMAENTDFDPLEKRLSTLRTGTGEQVVTELCEHLQWLFDGLEQRGRALKEAAAPGEPAPRKTSRALAAADERLRPRVVVIDECQNLFMHKEHGEWAASVVHQLVSTARKYGIVLILLTPEPSTASLPRKSMSIISTKACFAIGDQQSNDAILGTGSYRRGESATSLEPATEEDNGDVGTAMTKGFRKKPSLVRFFYINETEMSRIGQRATVIADEGGGVRPTVVQTPTSRDLLDDLDEVLDEQPIKAKDAAAALRTLAPRWQPYAKLDGKGLAQRLADDYEIRCPRPGNVTHVSPKQIRQALAHRATTDDNPDPDGGLDVDDDFTD